MKKLEHLMAATDMSPGSINAIDRAYLLAKKSGARLVLLHAFDTGKLKSWRELLGKKSASVSKKLVGEATRQLTEICADHELNRGIKAKLQVEQGAAVNTILRHSTKQGVDLLLTGAHGTNAFRDLLVGSTTSMLVRKSKIPVLVVRKKPRSDYRKVLVTVDFSAASEDLIRMARRVAPGAILILVHIYEVPFESKMRFAGVNESVIVEYRAEALVQATRKLHKLADKTGLPKDEYSVIVEHGDAAHHILQYQQRHRCDLIAIGKHGTNIVDEFLLGSVTENVLTRTGADVLIVTDNRRPAELP